MIRGSTEFANSPGMLNLYGAVEKTSVSRNIGFNHGSGTGVLGKDDGGGNLDGTRALIKAYGIDQREMTPSSSYKRQLKADHHYSHTKKAKTWRDAEDEEFNWEEVIKSKPAASGFFYPLPSGQVSPPPPPSISSWKHGHKIPPKQQFKASNLLMQQPPHQAIVPPNNNNNNNDPSTGSASISGILCSLMAQGVISLKKEAPPIQDSVPLEFNPDSLKVRHESVINSLYADLPRQCKTCGRRFKWQEEHGDHMDWHLTNNRRRSSLKTRKEKRCRNWFVTDTLWLASAANAVPQFSDTEKNSVDNNHKDDTVGVPADYSQRGCALCGEDFEDFYSEETEDWMYKGATYMNRCEFGHIVHAKCMHV